MKIYLDTSALNRIFDDQSQPRIYLESSSMLVVFVLIESQVLDIVSSDVLLFENLKNPHNERRTFVGLILKRYTGNLNAKNPMEFVMDLIKGEENDTK